MRLLAVLVLFAPSLLMAFTAIDYPSSKFAGYQSPYFISPQKDSSQASKMNFEVGIKRMMQFYPDERKSIETEVGSSSVADKKHFSQNSAQTTDKK